MKLVFCYDSRFMPDDAGNIVTNSALPYSVWSRYAPFDTITVVARRGNAGYIKGGVVSSGPKVSFELVPNFVSATGLVRHGISAHRAIDRAVRSADAVLVRLHSEVGLLGAKAARRHGKPLIVELVGCAWDGYLASGSLVGSLYAPIIWWRTRQEVAKASHVIYVTEHELQRRYPTRGKSIGIANVEIGPTCSAVLERRLQRYMTVDRPIVFGTIGTLRNAYKGLDIAFRALAEARSGLPPFKYKILGAGDIAPWRERARRAGIEDLVEFCGYLPAGEAVLDWLDGIDIYLQPSLQEGLPRALIEAMSRGCPALASNAGGTPELLAERFVHRRGNFAQLGEHCKALARSSADLQAAARANFSTAQMYNRDTLFERRRSFLMTFCGDHGLPSSPSQEATPQ